MADTQTLPSCGNASSDWPASRSQEPVRDLGQFPQVPDQSPNACPLGDGFGCVKAVDEACLSRMLQSFGRAWPGRGAAVQPALCILASLVLHRRRSAERARAGPGTTTRRPRRIAAAVPVLQPATIRLCLRHPPPTYSRLVPAPKLPAPARPRRRRRVGERSAAGHGVLLLPVHRFGLSCSPSLQAPGTTFPATSACPVTSTC